MSNTPDYKAVRKGKTFCSPSCGCGCKRSDYEKAKDEAAKTAKELGHGWRPVVWENMGWHWRVVKGKCEVHKLSANFFWATVEIGKDQYEFGSEKRTAKGALRSLKQKLAEISREMRTLIVSL